VEDLINFLNGFNVQTILSMSLILWLFIREFRAEIKKEIEEIKKENSVQAARSDKLYQMFIDLLTERRRD